LDVAIYIEPKPCIALNAQWYSAVVDLDLQIRGGGGHPDPEIMGAGTLGPQFGLKIREGRQPSPPRVPPLDLPL